MRRSLDKETVVFWDSCHLLLADGAVGQLQSAQVFIDAAVAYAFEIARYLTAVGKARFEVPVGYQHNAAGALIGRRPSSFMTMQSANTLE